MSRAIKILSFQNFYEVLKTCSAGRKDFFDTLSGTRISVCRFLTVKGPGLSGETLDGSAGELSFSEFERGM